MLLAAIALVCGLVVGWAVRGRSAGKLRGRLAAATAIAPGLSFLAVYDGLTWSLGPAVLVRKDDTQPAVEVSGMGHTLPMGAVIELRSVGLTLYIYASSRVQLIEQDALQSARETVDMAAMFTGGGQGRSYLSIAALVVPILLSVMVWFSISGSNSNTSKALESIGAIKAAVVDKPIACRVVP